MPKRELSIEECEQILERAEVGYLAMSREGQPYCLPFNFLYNEGRIYMHTGVKGQKHEYLGSNPRVSFTVAIPGAKISGDSPCQYTYKFASVLVVGNAEYIGDSAAALEALNLLIDKYRVTPVTPVPDDKFAKVRMLRINIDKISGRESS